MKKVIASLLIVSTIGISCKKSDPPQPIPTVKFMSLTAGSTWNYELVNSTNGSTSLFTVTSTNRDTIIMSKSYHVFTNNSGSANEYYNITGNDYFNYRSLPAALGGSNVENLYLKDNTTPPWNQTYPLTISGIALTAVVTNTITAKGISKTVKGKVYTDVIHVTTTISGNISGAPLPPGALTTDIQSFYAAKVGLIHSINKININFPGFPASSTDQQTNLITSDIK